MYAMRDVSEVIPPADDNDYVRILNAYDATNISEIVTFRQCWCQHASEATHQRNHV